MVSVAYGRVREAVRWHTWTFTGPYCCHAARSAGKPVAAVAPEEATDANATVTAAATKVLTDGVYSGLDTPSIARALLYARRCLGSRESTCGARSQQLRQGRRLL